MTEPEFVGGSIFGKIKLNDHVVPGLKHCLYCEISHRDKNSIREIHYSIPLLDVNHNSNIKQCPVCKIVYLLADRLIPEEKGE